MQHKKGQQEMMGNSIDYSTLNWVKQEIDETLNQARQALEEHVEHPDDPTQLRFCVTYLHQVWGTLQMVELYGASLLAEEMEHLTQALIDGRATGKDDVYETLMRGILQLPDYLESVLGGLVDDPLVLLPLLNDLRAARGENLLSENSLFAPDLSGAGAVLTEQRASGLAENELIALAKKLRPVFQLGLVNWYRDQDPKGGLKKISDVLNQLEEACNREESVRLWWVGQGVMEALLDGGLDSSVAVKLMVGQIERELKALIDGGEQALVDGTANELLKNMLYYCARATTEGERVQAIRHKFHLAGAMASAGEIENARERLGGPNQTMMETVAAAIREDLATAKDALDLFLRNERKIEDFAPQTENLRRVADTLGMLGLGVPRKVVLEQNNLIKDMLQGQVEPSEERLMEIAGSLLFVESSLESLVENRVASLGTEPATDAGEATRLGIPQAEFRQIKGAVFKEMAAGLVKAKEAIVSFVDAPWDYSLLGEVPGLLNQVRGAMLMIALEQPASLLKAVTGYITRDLIDQQKRPDQEQLDALADAIASIEYYLEATQDARSNREAILAVAEQGLSKLDVSLEAPVGETSDVIRLDEYRVSPEAPTGDSPEARIEDVTEADAEEIVLDATQVDQEAPESVAEAAQGEDDETLIELTGDVEEMCLDELTTPSDEAIEVPQEEPAGDVLPAPEPSDERAPPARQAFSLPPDIDQDILDIFIEEAREELAAIDEVLPQWKAASDDSEKLTRIRRAFHTLKGSGRLVGATEIGEFAWSIENMLNRVLDGTIVVGGELLALMDEAMQVLPRLVDALQGAEGPEADVQSLIDRGFAIVDQSKAKALPETPVIAEIREAGADEDRNVSEDQTGGMDPLLYDIFSKESAGHLQQLDDFVEQCCANAQRCDVSESLIRALHTLHGSARMAGADPIAELGGLLEKYAKALASNSSPLPAEGLSALTEGVISIKSMLGQLNQAGTLAAPGTELLDTIRALYAGEQAKIDERLRQEQAAATGSQAREAAADLEYDSELVEVFLEEASEILDSSESILQRWRSAPDDDALVVELQRELHTLKGGARMAGVTAIGDLSHAVESLLTDIAENGLPVSAPMFDVLHNTLDCLFGMLERTQERRAVEPAPDIIQELEALRQGESAEPVDQNESEHTISSETEVAEPEVRTLPTLEAAEALAVVEWDEPRQGKSGKAQELIRVPAELLDNLVNSAGEVSIYRSRLEQQNGAFRFNLVELEQTVARLRDQLRKLEIETEAQILYRYEIEGEVHADFDPLEMDRYSHMQQLSRALMESVADISSIEGLLDNLTRESETLLIQQARVNTDLQEGLMRTRMVPFTGLVPRMRRIVRQTARELGKQAELHVFGEQGEMDRTVLERIISPLEHMLRNALAHGIESPAERKARGKPEAGKLTLSLGREGAEVVIQLADDGGGIDLDAIRKKARERGLLDDSATLSDNEVMQFILESGFSTAKQVTQISGRGVGMDVVNSEIKQLGGSLHIDSRQGHATTFTVRLPFTLAVNHALLVSLGEETYAIPLTSIEGIVRLTRDELLTYFDDPAARYEYAGHKYQVRPLGRLLGNGGEILASGSKLFPIMLVRSGDHRVALQVDGLLGSREIVVKSVGPQLSTVRGVSGATILGDGRVVLILDVSALTRVSVSAKFMAEAPIAEEPQAQQGVTVMVVDDSITVRKVTSRLLERNDMQVLTAKDGVDAVALLQEQIPDVMLLDIEMPRMDGFELATHIRNEPRLKHIPIIMITSRTGDKHRRRAEEIGVNRYLGKPYQESELMENIRELLGEKHGRS